MREFFLFFILMSLVSISCKKDSYPEASIYVVDASLTGVADQPVRFFISGNAKQDNYIDTTIYSNDQGEAFLVLNHPAYLDVEVLYKGKSDNLTLVSTTANFIENRIFVDTLILEL